ncbi:hypothetical protein EV363DRAFT_1131149, partial [Boletus edulis]
MGLMSWIKERRGLAWQLGEDDIVVFVVGPSGSGKSAFVAQATKSADLVKVGTSLRPCTATVQAIRCELTDGAKDTLGVKMQKNIVFVDTPSFRTLAGRLDEAAEREMKNWLKNSKSKSPPSLVRTIYMHRVETDPQNDSIQQHLNSFACTFPKEFASPPKRLHAVFSYEGVIPDHTVQLRRDTFEAQLAALRPSLGRLKWDTSFHPNLFRHSDSETAWQAVIALF